MKYLLWIVIGYVIVWWILNNRKTTNTPHSEAKHEANNHTERMLQCMHCGIYVPASEAVLDITGTPYCSVKHQRQHADT